MAGAYVHIRNGLADIQTGLEDGIWRGLKKLPASEAKTRLEYRARLAYEAYERLGSLIDELESQGKI